MLPFLIIAATISTIAAFTDLRSGRIPNWLTLSGMLLGVMGHLLQGWHSAGWQTGLHECVDAFAGLALCSLAPVFLYWKGGMGGGDLKLFAAIGALCQPMLGIECQLYCMVIAGIVAPARLVYRGVLFRVLAGSFWMLLNPFLPVTRRRQLPPETMTWFRLGPAILAGTLAVLVIHPELWLHFGKVMSP